LKVESCVGKDFLVLFRGDLNGLGSGEFSWMERGQCVRVEEVFEGIERGFYFLAYESS
jgi:hypothetical protein